MGTAAIEPYPLSRGYTREKGVLADIAELDRLPPSAFWRRIANCDFHQPDCPGLETLVYLVRSMCRSGRREDAWQIAEILIQRISRGVMQSLARIYGISRDQVEELKNDLLGELYEDWLSLEPADEFWEVRFGICLNRKLIDAKKRHQRIQEHEVVLTGASDAESSLDPLEQMPDLSATDPESASLVRAALDSLPEPLRSAFFLAEHEGWTEESIAVHLGVTSRTVRNYLARARKHLEPWRG